MKILPIPLIREADAYTIVNEPVAGIDLMERAAAACFGWLKDKISTDRHIIVFCGSGNNGGDGLARAPDCPAGGGHRKAPPDDHSVMFQKGVATPVGLEPTTCRLEGGCSIL